MENRKTRIAISAQSYEFENYVTALQAAGAEAETFDPQKGAGYYDGLVVPGGGDVDPRLYGQQDKACEYVNPDLDALDASVLELFASLGKPVLGICRGQQLINVAYGGSLIQNISSPLSHRTGQPDRDAYHPVTIVRDCFLADLYGREFTVNSSHHQAVLNLAPGFEVLANAEDGIVEAIGHEDLPIYAVQFHPERMCLQRNSEECADGMKLLVWFVEKCTDR